MSHSRVSVAEVARITGRSPETVRRAIRSGALAWERVGDRGWYSVSAADVEALIQKSRSAEDAAGAEGLAEAS
jgi:DeoR/GlpR family transcriptional regulator of sugar metabolism